MVDYTEPVKGTVTWTEPVKPNAPVYIDERSDWFYNGWFCGWFFNDRFTPIYTTPAKPPPPIYTKPVKQNVAWFEPVKPM